MRSKRGLGASQLRPRDDPGMAQLRRIKSGQLEYASTRQPPRCGFGLLIAPHPNFVIEGCDQDADEYREGKADENLPADP